MSRHSTLTDPALHEIKGAAAATAGQIPVATGVGTAPFATPPYATTGGVRKSLTTVSLANTTGTTVIPFDNTIPQNTEGTQVLTTTWTPSATGNIILVEVDVFGSYSVASPVIIALFKDAAVDALCATSIHTSAVNETTQVKLRYQFAAPSTSGFTLNVRAGGSNAGTFILNGNAGAGLFGGLAISSIKITETTA